MHGDFKIITSLFHWNFWVFYFYTHIKQISFVCKILITMPTIPPMGKFLKVFKFLQEEEDFKPQLVLRDKWFSTFGFNVSNISSYLWYWDYWWIHYILKQKYTKQLQSECRMNKTGLNETDFMLVSMSGRIQNPAIPLPAIPSPLAEDCTGAWPTPSRRYTYTPGPPKPTQRNTLCWSSPLLLRFNNSVTALHQMPFGYPNHRKMWFKGGGTITAFS